MTKNNAINRTKTDENLTENNKVVKMNKNTSKDTDKCIHKQLIEQCVLKNMFKICDLIAFTNSKYVKDMKIICLVLLYRSNNTILTVVNTLNFTEK